MVNEFALDILWVLRELQLRSDTKEIDVFADAVARYLLVQLGLSTDEVDEVNNVFFARINADGLGNFKHAVMRIQDETKDNDFLKGFIISAMAATNVAQSDRTTLNAEQHGFVLAFQDLLDMKPSQFQLAVKRGHDFVDGLAFVAKEYLKVHPQQESGEIELPQRN